MGYQSAFILAAFVGLAQVMPFLIFAKRDKKWRRQSTGRYLRYMAEIVEGGARTELSGEEHDGGRGRRCVEG